MASAFTLALVSCGSTPKEKPVQVQEPKIETPKTVDVPVVKDNSDELSKTEEARRAAIEAGAKDAAPVQFAATEALYTALQEQAKTGMDSSEALKDLQDRYKALADYSSALASKKKIDDNGYASYSQSKYDAGVQALSDMENLFSQTNLRGSTMLETAGRAKGSFDAVLFAAYKKLAKDERTAAFKAKNDADGIKAGVAAKDAYNSAVSEFKAGDSSYSMQNPESALNHYSNAKVEFTAIYGKVLAEREAAQKAMEAARAKVSESATYAQKADVEAPLTGDDIKGIEAADAKLLEDDNYDDPSVQEAALPETLLDEGDEK